MCTKRPCSTQVSFFVLGMLAKASWKSRLRGVGVGVFEGSGLLWKLSLLLISQWRLVLGAVRRLENVTAVMETESQRTV